jgi:hypothetical protein
MSTVDFLHHLFHHGEAVMHERPAFTRDERPAALRLLETAYAEVVLQTAGPPLAFDTGAALAAAQFLSQACWFLVKGDETETDVESALRFPPAPASAAAHLSADLCLRFLATVYRRARIRPREDAMHKSVVDVLRRWPLSGSASDLTEKPTADLSFFDHHGLQLLYAERLAANWRPSWIPNAGRTREVLELVLQQQGKKLPAPTQDLTPGS